VHMVFKCAELWADADHWVMADRLFYPYLRSFQAHRPYLTPFNTTQTPYPQPRNVPPPKINAVAQRVLLSIWPGWSVFAARLLVIVCAWAWMVNWFVDITVLEWWDW